MQEYYVNKIPQDNGDHEVHSAICSRLPDVENRMYLGSFGNCHSAVEEAKKHYPNSANGCAYCSPICHTS
jgi:hypothetical protein